MLKLARIGILILLAIPVFNSCSRTSITVHYEGNAQVELISTKGTRLLVDVYDPDKLSSPARESDILLTTHHHRDHFLSSYSSIFKGKKLDMTEGDIIGENLRIQGMHSTHSPQSGNNYFYIIDMDDTRIVHFGDIGQEKFSAEQLSKIGKVDLAIMQFDNSYSEMNIQNKNGFRLMSEIQPALIIPTHFSIEASEYVKTMWPCFYTERKTMNIYQKSRASKETRLLFMTSSTQGYAQIAKAKKWKE